jgi:hypothetical protein
MLDARCSAVSSASSRFPRNALSQLQKVIREPQRKPRREECFSYEDQLRRECINALSSSSKVCVSLNLTEITMYR